MSDERLSNERLGNMISSASGAALRNAQRKVPGRITEVMYPDELVSALVELRELRAREREAAAIIERFQWAVSRPDNFYCPACGVGKYRSGKLGDDNEHGASCGISRWLGGFMESNGD